MKQESTQSHVEPSPVKGVIFDISGTVLDYGSRGPVIAFIEFFRRHAVEVTEEEARRPMGKHKIDHILAMLDDPSIADRWRSANGKLPSSSEMDQFYRQFTEVQIEVLGEYCDVIPGVAEVVDQLRSRGIKIANTTGFDFGMLQDLVPAAKLGGYQPDLWVTPDLVGRGRPAPWMIFHAAKELDIYPMSSIIKVGDTPADIEEAHNAGVWSVAVIRSGNEVGLSEADLLALTEDQREEKLSAARDRLASFKPHYLIDTVADLMPVIDQVSNRILAGEKP